MEQVETALKCCCVLEGAAVNFDGDLEKLGRRFLNKLAAKLQRTRVYLEYVPEWDDASLRIRFVQVEQGNRLLRYLVPFIAPAFVEIEVELVGADGAPLSGHYRQSAHIGVFGGSSAGMLGVCVDRIAVRLADNLRDRMA